MRTERMERRRQLRHLALATGVLAKYGKDVGPIPSPEDYRQMLQELLDCISLTSANAGRGTRMPMKTPVKNTRRPGQHLSNSTSAIAPPQLTHTPTEALVSANLNQFRGMLRSKCVLAMVFALLTWRASCLFLLCVCGRVFVCTTGVALTLWTICSK